MNEIFQAINRLRDDIANLKKSVDKITRPFPQIPGGPWLDSQDVLFALNISKRTLQNMRTKGEIPFTRIRGKFYYKASDLEAMLQNHYAHSSKTVSHG
jgi:hypothetical protein